MNLEGKWRVSQYTGIGRKPLPWTATTQQLKGALILAEQKLDVIVKAIKLMEYSMTVTSNRKRYPIKYIQLIKRIQNKSMDIYEFLLEANRLNVTSSKSERLELQTKAITSCDKLSCFVELSMNLNIIGDKTVESWQKQINDIKYMTIAWRQKDKVR